MITRNMFVGEGGPRTSMRLEPEILDAMRELCLREGITAAALVGRVADANPGSNLSSALRMHVLSYYREAATEGGHAAAGHGVLDEVVG